VESVNYPSLPSSKYYELSKKYFEKGTGSIFTFTIKGAGKKEAQAFINKLELFSHLANVADAKSLVIHPASTTHAQLSSEDLVLAGISEGTIRLSVGIENVADLIADLEQALA
jgi:O-acetylhomoserine (thiol)-lyase